MLHLKPIERWCIYAKGHIKDMAAFTHQGEKVTRVHTCPRCTELGCGPIQAIETEKGTLFMRNELHFGDSHCLMDAIMTYSIKPDLPCIDHDGVQ